MLFKKRPSWISQDTWLRVMRQRDRRKIWRRQAVRFFKSPRLAFAYAHYRKAIAAADWGDVKRHALTLAELAVKTKDRQTAGEMINALERVGCYEEASRLWLSTAGQTKARPNEWRGEDLSGKILFINLNRGSHGLGVGYRCAHIVAELIGCARRTMALLEPRQVPTFRRTFPGLEIFTSPDAVPVEEVDFVALPEYLMMEFDVARAPSSCRFQPLLADPAKTVQLRNKYLAKSGGNRRPLIGLSWYSGHHGKDLPPLSEWHDFVARTDATFVSLQYGNVVNDVKTIGADRIVVDETIDQLKDMDAFAAQVAALDGVITIISTLTNVGAALGVPTVVLRDDWFRRNLPFLSDRVPWYPSLRVAGKDKRPWGSVLDEAFSKLVALHSEQTQTR